MLTNMTSRHFCQDLLHVLILCSEATDMSFFIHLIMISTNVIMETMEKSKYGMNKDIAGIYLVNNFPCT